jgi:hypothetical protein
MYVVFNVRKNDTKNIFILKVAKFKNIGRPGRQVNIVLSRYLISQPSDNYYGNILRVISRFPETKESVRQMLITCTTLGYVYIYIRLWNPNSGANVTNEASLSLPEKTSSLLK